MDNRFTTFVSENKPINTIVEIVLISYCDIKNRYPSYKLLITKL